MFQNNDVTVYLIFIGTERLSFNLSALHYFISLLIHLKLNHVTLERRHNSVFPLQMKC